ncbi:MAG TPA: DUF1440 domain-containing protein [Verrucomicrobiae bacterium]|nr:DUF1440 domain-containing protein [Verrucomicrobiae bacterium]
MNLLKSIVLGGLVAGFLDGADALIFTKVALGFPPGRLLQYIASGLLGLPAFRGGWHTVALGVSIHFSIAMVAAAVFCIASTRIRTLTERPLLSGAAFGLVVYAFMHYVVLPLSALPKRTIPVTRLEIANLLFSHIFFVGMPIALAAKHTKSS